LENADLWANFDPNLGQELPSNTWLCHLSYDPLASCKKSEKTNEPFLRKRVTDGRTDRQS